MIVATGLYWSTLLGLPCFPYDSTSSLEDWTEVGNHAVVVVGVSEWTAELMPLLPRERLDIKADGQICVLLPRHDLKPLTSKFL